MNSPFPKGFVICSFIVITSLVLKLWRYSRIPYTHGRFSANLNFEAKFNNEIGQILLSKFLELKHSVVRQK
jgi:hypothetical protein